MNVDTILALGLTAIAAIYLAWRTRRYLTAGSCGGCGAKQGCPAVKITPRERA